MVTGAMAVKFDPILECPLSYAFLKRVERVS
jgi:hypothetical protein